MSSDDEDFEDMMMASDYPLLGKRRAGHMPNMEGAQDDAQDEVENSTPTTLPRWSAVSMFWQVPTTAVPNLFSD